MTHAATTSSAVRFQKQTYRSKPALVNPEPKLCMDNRYNNITVVLSAGHQDPSDALDKGCFLDLGLFEKDMGGFPKLAVVPWGSA